MSVSLHDQIQQLTDRFVADVLQTLRTAKLDEIFGELAGFLPERRRPSSPRSSRSTGRTYGDPSDRILALLRSHPNGLRAEPIRKELGIEKPPFVRAINGLLVGGAVRKHGQRRATTYFVGNR